MRAPPVEHRLRLSGHLGVSVRFVRMRRVRAGRRMRKLLNSNGRNDADCGFLSKQ